MCLCQLIYSLSEIFHPVSVCCKIGIGCVLSGGLDESVYGTRGKALYDRVIPVRYCPLVVNLNNKGQNYIYVHLL